MPVDSVRKILAATLLPLNVFLIAFFAAQTGLKSYVVISAVVTFGWLGFMFVVLKRGFVLGRRITIAKDDSPKKFYANIAFLLLGYLVMILFSVGLYLQEIGYLARD